MKQAQATRVLTRPLNLRIDSKTRQRIETLAIQHGVKVSDIVRFAMADKIPEWEKTGVHLKKAQ